MSPVIIRIGLRYVAAALVSLGLISPDLAFFQYDPDVEAAVQVGLGTVAGAAAEGWYFFARRFGWAK